MGLSDLQRSGMKRALWITWWRDGSVILVVPGFPDLPLYLSPPPPLGGRGKNGRYIQRLGLGAQGNPTTSKSTPVPLRNRVYANVSLFHYPTRNPRPNFPSKPHHLPDILLKGNDAGAKKSASPNNTSSEKHLFPPPPDIKKTTENRNRRLPRTPTFTPLQNRKRLWETSRAMRI